MDTTNDHPEDFSADVSAATWAALGKEPWQHFRGPTAREASADRPMAVVLRVGYADGRLVATGLHIEMGDGQALTAEDLRRVSIPKLLGIFGTKELAKEQPPSSFATAASVRRPGSRGHPDGYYRTVAEVYRAALLTHPHRPMAATAERLTELRPGNEAVAVSTARRLVATARERGYLEVEQ
jgi:hypothetical protein